jgi:hypothetical protein
MARPRGHLYMRPLVWLSFLVGCNPDTEIDTRESSDSPVDSVRDTGEFCHQQGFNSAPVPQLAECYDGGNTTIPTLAVVTKWVNAEMGAVTCTPMVGQLTDDDANGRVDSDDSPDIVVVSNDGVVWALSGSGSTLWSASGGKAGDSPAIGDLDGDGWSDVVVANDSGVTALRGSDGSILWYSSDETGVQSGSPGLADLDGDGAAEVVIGGQILSGQNGAVLGTGCCGGTDAFYARIGVAADVDADGQQEVVVGNALYDIFGDTIWFNGETDGLVGLANFDADPMLEIVVASDGVVRLQDDDGSVVWSAALPSAYLRSGTPTIADFDGDGAPEIGVAAVDKYVMLDTDGSVQWVAEAFDRSSGLFGASAFDLDGDGVSDVIFADTKAVYGLNGRTGTLEFQSLEHSSGTLFEYPTVADLDHDGHAEIIYTSEDGDGEWGGVRVLSDANLTWPGARGIWNQHAYSINNVDDDGTIPTSPEPAGSSYNSFRSADLVVPTAHAPVDYAADLYPVIDATCQLPCGNGLLNVWYSIGNQGYRYLDEPIAVEFWGTSSTGDRLLLGSATWSEPLFAGKVSADDFIQLIDVPSPLYDLTMIIDGGDNSSAGVVHECHEDNNSVTWPEPICG